MCIKNIIHNKNIIIQKRSFGTKNNKKTNKNNKKYKNIKTVITEQTNVRKKEKKEDFITFQLNSERQIKILVKKCHNFAFRNY